MPAQPLAVGGGLRLPPAHPTTDCKEGLAIANNQRPASDWKRAKGLPAGTEYVETDGCVSVRLWRGDCYQIEGPADLRGGSIEELVHMLLDQMRSTD